MMPNMREEIVSGRGNKLSPASKLDTIPNCRHRHRIKKKQGTCIGKALQKIAK